MDRTRWQAMVAMAAISGGCATCVVVACSPATAVRPDAPTYAGATGSMSCAVVEGRQEPFVVDWRADRRGDLEVAMNRGVTIVAYDCQKLAILADCSVAAEPYAFAGVTPKEQVIRLQSSDEVQATFPLTGSALSGKLGAELSRGATLDLGLAIIGKRSSVRPFLLKKELRGQCEGATHFVRSATVGAFTMRTGTRGAVNTAAELFASVRTQSSSTQVIENRDGDLAECRSAKLDSDKPPARCATPLRLELRSILSEPPQGPAASSDAEEAVRCPRGMVALESGRCVPPSPKIVHLCSPEDPADCGAQCERGSLSSCAILGRSYVLGRGVPKDIDKARTFLGRACDGGSMQGCGRLGEVLVVTGDVKRGMELLDTSCSAGWFTACETLGALALSTPGAAAVKIDVFATFKRTCAGGDAEGCWVLGSMFDVGLGVRKSEIDALRYYDLACKGDAKLGCTSYAGMLDDGRGVASDPTTAARILESSCERAFFSACSSLSSHYFTGRGVPKDDAKGVRLLERACEGKAVAGCFTLATRYMTGSAVPRDEARSKDYFRKSCELGQELACAQLRK